MASHTFCSGPLPWTQLRTVQRGDRQRRLKCTITVAGVSKKVNTYDDKWSKVRLSTRPHCTLPPSCEAIRPYARIQGAQRRCLRPTLSCEDLYGHPPPSSLMLIAALAFDDSVSDA